MVLCGEAWCLGGLDTRPMPLSDFDYRNFTLGQLRVAGFFSAKFCEAFQTHNS